MCKTLEQAPTGNGVRYHLNKLDNLEELEAGLNETLRARVPGRLQNSTRLLDQIAELNVTVKRFYLDRGFYSVPVIRWLQACGTLPMRCRSLCVGNREEHAPW